MILVGFIMPWFTCNIAGLIQGSFSGVTQLIAMLATLLTALFGGLTSDTAGELAASGVVIVVFVVATAFLAAIPVAGVYIGIYGLQLLRALRMPYWQKARLSRALIKAALVGLVPVACYVAIGSAIPTVRLTKLIPGLPGIGVQSTGQGVWVTLAGFVVAIAAGFGISVTVSLAKQLAEQPPAKRIGTATRDQGEEPPQ
jgi:hypothetical protein